MLIRFEILNPRDSDAFSENCDGPVMEFRGAFPHSPDAGAANAARFRKALPVSPSTGAPVTFGRRLPVIPVPCTGARIIGVSGMPLPSVSWPANVHDFSRPRLQLSEKKLE